jgi:hypothetical protein
MTLAELGMPSIPSLLPIPRIGQTLDDDGRPTAAWSGHLTDRFWAEFLWYARALRRERADGTAY